MDKVATMPDDVSPGRIESIRESVIVPEDLNRHVLISTEKMDSESPVKAGKSAAVVRGQADFYKD